jgi:hypothetical protein
MSDELPALPRIPFERSVQDILAASQGTTDILTQQNALGAEEMPQFIIETDKETGKPKVSAKGLDMEFTRELVEALNFKRQAMAGMQDELTRLNQQEKNLSHGMGPIFNALATVGGNLAIADPRLPPVVRALGQSAKDLNPTLQQVRRQKLGVLGGISDQAQEMSQMGLGVLREQRLDERMKEQTDIQKKGQEIELARLGATQQEQVLDNFRPIAAAGTLTPQMADNAKQQFMDKGGSLKDAEAFKQNLLQQNQAALDSKPLDKVQKSEKGPDGKMHDYVIYIDPKTQKEQGRVDVGLKEPTVAESMALEKRRDREQSVESLAEMMLSKDPFTLMQIKGTLGLRGDLTPEVITRARKLAAARGEKWSPEMNRERVRLVDSLTEGKLSQSNTSLGQWLNHADEADNIVRELAQTNPEVVGKSINWMTEKFTSGRRAELVGRLRTAFAAVGDEYLNFILSNRAPYQTDKESKDKMLDLSKPLRTQLGVINQMGRTIGGRQSENNNQWRRWFDDDIPMAISPQAQRAAARLGVPVSVGLGREGAGAAPAAALGGGPIARAPEGTPDGPVQYKGKPAVVRGGIIYAQ